MTDREKVIKGLECCRDVQSGWKDARYVCSTCPYTDNGIPCETLVPLVDDAIALLKAQEPRAVLSIFKAHEGTFGNCPVCGTELMDYYNEKCCGRCGQAVKWE